MGREGSFVFPFVSENKGRGNLLLKTLKDANANLKDINV